MSVDATNKQNLFENLALIGSGYTGRMLGRYVKAKGIVGQIVAYDKTPANAATTVNEEGADRAAETIEDAVKDADLVIMATPITGTKEYLPDVLDFCKPDAIISDFGRTKVSIAKIAEAHPRVVNKEIFFVGSDPLVTNRDSTEPEEVFSGVPCILTKTPMTDPIALSRLVEFWRTIGAQVAIMRPARHDKLVSWIEQLQLIIVAASMLTLIKGGEDQNLITGIAGTVLRDSTACLTNIDADQFDDVLNENRDNLREGLHIFQEELKSFDEKLSNLDDLKALLNQAVKFRKGIDK